LTEADISEPALRRCYEDALRATFGDLERALGALAEEWSPWSLALRALRYFALARPQRSELPSLDEISRFAGASPADRGVASLAAAQRVRAALLDFDGPAIEEARAVLDELAGDLTHSEAGDWLAIADAWTRIARSAPIDARLADVEGRARHRGNADQVIEASVARALSAELAGEIDEALSIARRASRMARSESMPQLEFLAHLCLARLRRVSGHPHLTMRIVSALGNVATPPWRGWIAWEKILCGADVDATRDDAELCRALSDVVRAARAGEVASFAEAAGELLTRAERFAPMFVDAQHLLAAIDPLSDLSRAPSSVRDFCRGEIHDVPRGLHGVCDVDVNEGAPHVYVFSVPGHVSRRILAPGAGLARSAAPGIAEIRGDGRQLRTDSAVAALAVAGESGVEEGELFRQLYGFDYEPARHQSVRGVLYGRIKKRLGDAGELVRSEGRIRIAHRGLLVVDPRSSPPPEQRILSILAERKRSGAKAVANELGIPLRTVQEALRRMRDDGVLRSEKAARGLHYILEDTTFSEPTRDVRY
jgi:hypothetical protein